MLENTLKRLPIAGIVGFSLCSTWSLYQLFTIKAAHPTVLYWLPAFLVEIVTAWAVAQAVGGVRQLTRSNISKQDRRFFLIVTAAFALVALPLLSLSVWANTLEFSNVFLGSAFPLASITCAIGAAVPEVVARFEQAAERERQETQEARKRKAAERKQAQAMNKRLATLGKAKETLALFAANPTLSHSQAAQELGISRQAIGQHLARLEAEGLIKRNGSGVELTAVLPHLGKAQ